MLKAPSKTNSVLALLKGRIATGHYPVGGQMPTEVELARELSCSRDTVGKAIAHLAHEGLVERKKRFGTRVLRQAPAEPAGDMELDAYAFIYPSKLHEGVRRMICGFQDAADAAGRRVMMLSTGIDYHKEVEFVGRLQEFDVKGAVVYPVLSQPADVASFSQMLVASRYPIVLAEVNLPGVARAAVVVDGFHAGHTMTRHLIGQGLRRIGFVSNYSWTSAMRDKYQGYRRALQEAGLEEPVGGVLLDPQMHPNFTDPLAEPTMIARGYLAGAGNLEAVVCADDFLAAGICTAAAENGLSVPATLKVVSLNECLPGQSLTTYRVPYEEMGRQAFALLDALRQPQPPSPIEKQLTGTLVRRDSA